MKKIRQTVTSFEDADYCAIQNGGLEIESKDATIDHFLPKSKNPDEVVNWENLFPSCLRCNRKKNNREEKIINPCENEPREYLGIVNANRFRFKAIDSGGIGESTIDVIGLNDIRRVMGSHFYVCVPII